MDRDIENKVTSIYSGLGWSSRKVADYFLHHTEEVPSLTINEFAEQSKSSVATVSRFVKSMGYSSYQQMRWALTMQNNADSTSTSKISNQDSTITVAHKVISAHESSLATTNDLLDASSLQRVVDYLLNADSIGFFGTGESSIAASEAGHKFSMIRPNAQFTSDFHMQLEQASNLSTADTAIIYSSSGENVDTNRIAQVLWENKVHVIGISNVKKSHLAKFADLILVSSADSIQMGLNIGTSLFSQLAITDCLYTLYTLQSDRKLKERLRRVEKTLHDTRR